MEFKPITLDSVNELKPYLNLGNRIDCTESFATIFLWSTIYHSQYAIEEDALYIVSKKNEMYAFPRTEMIQPKQINLLLEEAHRQNYKLRIFGLHPWDKSFIEKHFSGVFNIYASRDSYEYIYEIEKMMEFSGKKLHAKRNFCNRFENVHPNWKFVELNQALMKPLLQMFERWIQDNEGPEDGGLHHESCVVRKALQIYEELQMTAGVLVENDQIFGFSIASLINPKIADINIEKAVASEEGAYPMVCREMAKLMKSKYPSLQFVNREEDMGDEGLRKSKESYAPVYLLEKYIAIEK